MLHKVDLVVRKELHTLAICRKRANQFAPLLHRHHQQRPSATLINKARSRKIFTGLGELVYLVCADISDMDERITANETCKKSGGTLHKPRLERLIRQASRSCRAESSPIE